MWEATQNKQYLYNVRATCLISHEICFYPIMKAFKETSAAGLPFFSHVTNGIHENDDICAYKKTHTSHSTRTNDTFTHCGISLISPKSITSKLKW